MVFAPPMIPGYGVSSGFEIYVQDQKGGKIEDLLSITRQMIDKLNARPEIARALPHLIPNSLNIWWKWMPHAVNATGFPHPMYFLSCQVI